MGKKMMKRTAALSALVAVALSGTVFAAEDLTIKADGVGLSNTPNQAQEVRSSVDVNALNITSGKHGILVFGNANNEPVTMTINANTIDVTANDSTAIMIAGDHDNANLDITFADSMTVTANGATHGITNVSDGGKLTITGGTKLKVTAGENGIYSRNADAKIDITADTVEVVTTYTGDNAAKGHAVMVDRAGAGVDITANELTITAAEGKKAVYATNGTINVTGKTTNTINGSVRAEKATEINIDGKYINIDAGGARGIDVNNGYLTTGVSAVVNFGSADTEKTTITNGQFGIVALNNGSEVNVKGNELVIEDVEIGMQIQNNSVSKEGAENYDADPTDNCTVTFENAATTITTNEGGAGLVVYSHAILDAQSDLYITAQDAIVTRGATVRINEANSDTTTVQLDGDVVFDYDGYAVDSDVTINLANANSYLEGNIYVDEPDASNLDTIVTGMSLGLTDGEWRTRGTQASFVNNLTMDGGIVKQNSTGDITVDNYSGTGSIVFRDETTGDVIVHNAASGAAVQLSMAGITADDIQSADDLNKVANKLEVSQETTSALSTNVYVTEGLINSEIEIPVTYQDVDGDGYYNANFTMRNMSRSYQPSDTVVATSGIAANAAVAWRDEDATFSQRLGELRNSEGDQGVWARMTQGEFERGNDFETEYNMFQIGYDKAKGDWHYGVAVSHNEGDTTYRIGSGEFTSTSLSAYGTWQGAKGHYKDIVAKIGVIDNEYTVSAAGQLTKGDYDTTGTSISGEYGMKNDMGDGWYVTPLAKMTYMHIGSAGYTTNNGIKVKHKSVDSLIARLGVELGKQLGTKGDVYVKASALHDFGGDADTVFRLGSNKATITDEIGGTWYEVGIGFNYKTSDATYLYADVIKTYGDEIRTPWQWNVGARYSF